MEYLLWVAAFAFGFILVKLFFTMNNINKYIKLKENSLAEEGDQLLQNIERENELHSKLRDIQAKLDAIKSNTKKG